MLSKYNKFIVGIIGAIAQVIQAQYSTNHYVQVGLAILTALGVYTIPNRTNKPV